MSKLRICDIPLENRPRERLLENGVDKLSDSELLALILEKGSKFEVVIDLSHRLINNYGLDSLNSLGISELMSLKKVI